jgi:hypothetical protein
VVEFSQKKGVMWLHAVIDMKCNTRTHMRAQPEDQRCLLRSVGDPTPQPSGLVFDVAQSYSAGPPYLIHATDVGPLAKEWSRLVPPTYDQVSHSPRRQKKRAALSDDRDPARSKGVFFVVNIVPLKYPQRTTVIYENSHPIMSRIGRWRNVGRFWGGCDGGGGGWG